MSTECVTLVVVTAILSLRDDDRDIQIQPTDTRGMFHVKHRGTKNDYRELCRRLSFWVSDCRSRRKSLFKVVTTGSVVKRNLVHATHPDGDCLTDSFMIGMCRAVTLPFTSASYGCCGEDSVSRQWTRFVSDAENIGRCPILFMKDDTHSRRRLLALLSNKSVERLCEFGDLNINAIFPDRDMQVCGIRSLFMLPYSKASIKPKKEQNYVDSYISED